MRTQYFQNIQSGHCNALKRITDTGVEYALREPEKGTSVWASSAYSADALKDTTKFKRLTRDEARKLRPSAFRSEKTTGLVLAPHDPVPAPVVKPGIELANKFRVAVGNLDYNGREKIAAIRAIRQIEGFGLAESKAIVENFQNFLAFVEEHNEFPVIDYNGWNEPATFTKKA